MELYWRLPVRLQETALSLFTRRQEKIFKGPVYEEWKEWLLGCKNWPRSSIKEWESQQLQYIIKTAAQKVPYYRNNWKGLDWKAVRLENDLHILPLLEKQSIRQHENSFISDDQNLKSLWAEKTSGTTGTSLKIYWPMLMFIKYQVILEVMIRYPAGVSHYMPRATMAGRVIIKGDTNHPPYWRYNKHWKQLYFSSYHISKMNAAEYIGALRLYGSAWITGYGSVIAALAKSALDAGIESYPVRNIIVSGDTLSKGMRSSVERFFQCKCFDFYGQCEGVAMAMECILGRMHVVPIFGIVEILREDGAPCELGEVGEIVATSLLNDAMPLVRYRTGDYAAWSKDQDCPCGNHNPVITNLEGRVDDYLVKSDGRKVGRLAAFKRSPSIHTAQLVQDNPGHAYLLIKPGEGYQASHADAICGDIRERIGKFEIDVVEVAEIPKTLQGKTKLVVRLEDQPAMRDIYEKVLGKNNALYTVK